MEGQTLAKLISIFRNYFLKRLRQGQLERVNICISLVFLNAIYQQNWIHSFGFEDSYKLMTSWLGSKYKISCLEEAMAVCVTRLKKTRRRKSRVPDGEVPTT
jgi:hypothetical protein